MPFLRRVLVLGLVASIEVTIAPTPASAKPMRLSDARPRWVTVRFEASPEDAPGQLDTRYGEALPAWLEPDAAPGRMRVTIPAHWVESRLLASQGARAGSVSDFTWLFDVRTGDVVSASLSGVLVRRLGVGVLRFEADVQIRTELGTLAAGGFRRPETLLGERIFEFCDPSRDEGCTAVPAVPYDPRTGYVNAVGFVDARALHVTTRSFSDLGEARFEELDEATLRSAALDGAAPRAAAVSAPGPGGADR
ncbi:MAG TPA: hypothetical protein VMW35_11630 [Myxococcota bacterium]|jgi:hypothetical protein|nr:hypothetical protein [Myxococcota bacterium]